MELREKLQQWLSPNLFDRIFIPLLIGLNLMLTIPYSAIVNIWLDEAYSLDTTGKDLGYALHQALHFELQPPAYFLLLNIWRSLNSSIFFARLFSILCIALTIYVTAALSKRFLQEIHPAWLTAYVAFNPYLIWAASEIRLYALVILISGLLILLFFDGYFSESPQKFSQWGYVLLSILALYTQYFLGAILVANGCVLLLLKRWKKLQAYVLNMVAVGVCLVPMVPIVLSQTSQLDTGLGKAPLLDNLSILFGGFWRYILPHRWIKEDVQVVIISVVFLIGLMAIAITYSRSFNARNSAVLIICITSWFLFLLLVLVTGASLSARYLSLLFILESSVIFAVLSLPRRFFKKFAIVLVTLAFLGMYTVSLRDTYNVSAKPGDYIRVSSYITTHEKPGQPILVFYSLAALPLAYYYSGQNLLVPIPQAGRFDKFDWNDVVLKNEQQIFSALSKVPGEHEKIWLIRTNNCEVGGYDFNCPLVDAFANKYYSVEKRAEFLGANVLLLRKKQV
jgi:uncharacterized membrane protein